MSPADDSLEDAARECLGQLFSLFPAPHDPATSPATWDRAVAVGFRGEKTGHLRLDFYGGAHADLVSGWVGGAVDATDENDVAGELANILCCHVLPSLFSPRALFHVESPRAVPDGPVSTGAIMARATIALPRGRIEARVFTETA